MRLHCIEGKKVMRFLFHKGILKRIGVISIEEHKELEQYLKRKQEMVIINQSNVKYK